MVISWAEPARVRLLPPIRETVDCRVLAARSSWAAITPISSRLVSPARRVRSPSAKPSATAATALTRRTMLLAIIRPNAAAASRPTTRATIVMERADSYRLWASAAAASAAAFSASPSLFSAVMAASAAGVSAVSRTDSTVAALPARLAGTSWSSRTVRYCAHARTTWSTSAVSAAWGRYAAMSESNLASPVFIACSYRSFEAVSRDKAWISVVARMLPMSTATSSRICVGTTLRLYRSSALSLSWPI